MGSRIKMQYITRDLNNEDDMKKKALLYWKDVNACFMENV